MNQLSPAEEASEQALAAVFSAIEAEHCFRLEAGAGAGKTYSLIEALKFLICEKSHDLSRREQQVACITYTNVAKDEIRDRTDNHPVIFADTIHAFCWGFIQGFQSNLREIVPDLGGRWHERIEEAGGINGQKVVYDIGYPSIDDQVITLHHDDVVVLMAKLLESKKFQSLLKSKYPIILVDEYQDTDVTLARSIVDHLVDNDSGILVGLFGDHWQKIYGSKSCGLIQSASEKIIEIGKNANFRSDKNIVECLNRMRPELPQCEKDPNSLGSVSVFHSNGWLGERLTGGHWAGDLPANDAHNYFEAIKEILRQEDWDFESKSTKVLMLTNNVLASEQGYKALADCFNNTDDYLKKNNAYIRFFLDVVEPMVVAFEQKKYGEVFHVVNQKFPHLTNQEDKKLWAEDLKRLSDLRKTGTIGDILDFLSESKKPRLSKKVEASEDRYRQLLEIAEDDLDGGDKRTLSKISKLRSVSYQELISLREYIEDKTPFSTKHGVKGAQFDNVLVVCGRGWNHYNWNQMLEWFGAGPPGNKQNAFERNRNLFYVACSRAKHNLALLFTQDLSDHALAVLGNLFEEDNVKGNVCIADAAQ